MELTRTPRPINLRFRQNVLRRFCRTGKFCGRSWLRPAELTKPLPVLFVPYRSIGREKPLLFFENVKSRKENEMALEICGIGAFCLALMGYFLWRAFKNAPLVDEDGNVIEEKK